MRFSKRGYHWRWVQGTGCSPGCVQTFTISRMPSRQTIAEALALIFDGIARLKKAFPNRAFTIDGRLVGDIGDIIAALEYDVVLHEVSQPDHDAVTPDGRSVQIKATFERLAHVQDRSRLLPRLQIVS